MLPGTPLTPRPGLQAAGGRASPGVPHTKARAGPRVGGSRTSLAGRPPPALLEGAFALRLLLPCPVTSSLPVSA